MTLNDPFNFKEYFFQPDRMPVPARRDSALQQPFAQDKKKHSRLTGIGARTKSSSPQLSAILSAEASDRKQIAILGKAVNELNHKLQAIKQPAAEQATSLALGTTLIAWAIAWLIHVMSYLLIPLAFTALFSVLAEESRERAVKKRDKLIDQLYDDASEAYPDRFPRDARKKYEVITKLMEELHNGSESR